MDINDEPLRIGDEVKWRGHRYTYRVVELDRSNLEACLVDVIGVPVGWIPFRDLARAEPEREDDREDGPYDVPTTGTFSRARRCGCRVGLLSDVEELPRRQRMHAGSIPNPWIVIPCESHAEE